MVPRGMSTRPESRHTPVASYPRRLLILVLVLTGCATPAATIESVPSTTERSQAVSRADFDAWPLTVESGALRCEAGRAVVFEAAGKVYALNGIAIADPQYEDLNPIWAADPTGAAPKMSISDLIEAGLALC